MTSVDIDVATISPFVPALNEHLESMMSAALVGLSPHIWETTEQLEPDSRMKRVAHTLRHATLTWPDADLKKPLGQSRGEVKGSGSLGRRKRLRRMAPLPH